MFLEEVVAPGSWDLKGCTHIRGVSGQEFQQLPVQQLRAGSEEGIKYPAETPVGCNYLSWKRARTAGIVHHLLVVAEAASTAREWSGAGSDGVGAIGPLLAAAPVGTRHNGF